MINETEFETTEVKLYRMLTVIRRHPGIRASEINRKLHLQHSWKLRLVLLRRSLVRKENDGMAVRYFPAASIDQLFAGSQ